MKYVVTWIRSSGSIHMGYFGPFDSYDEARDFAQERDQYYPPGYFYKIVVVCPPEYVRQRSDTDPC